jgi:superfamily II DNA helicase RecQ
MTLKFFLIPIANLVQAEAELNAFLRSHRVLKTDRNGVDEGASSFWAICVDYLDGSSAQETVTGKREAIRGKIDYRLTLPPDEFEQFARLRELRKEIAAAEAVPVYTIFTNEQLATMVREHVITKGDLEKIAGVGDARVLKYADRFLAVQNSKGNVTDASSGPPV